MKVQIERNLYLESDSAQFTIKEYSDNETMLNIGLMVTSVTSNQQLNI